MPGIQDEISPDYVDKQLLVLSLADTESQPRAFRAVDISVNYDGAEPNGVALPLELLVKGPSVGSFFRHVYRRVVPSLVTFTPNEGGEHLVTLREVDHNRWWGSLVVNVSGEQLNSRGT